MAESRVREKSPLDLAGQLTDRVEGLVELIRDKSTRPILSIVRAIVVGAVVGLIALTALVVIIIAVMKLFNHDVFGGRVWATDFLFGGMLLGAGVFFLAKSGLRKAE